MLWLFLKVDHRLESWSKREVKRAPPRPRQLHSQLAQSKQTVPPTRHRSSVPWPHPPLLSLVFFSCAEHYTLSLSSSSILLAADLYAELHIDRRFPIFPSQTAKQNVFSFLPNSAVFSELFDIPSPTSQIHENALPAKSSFEIPTINNPFPATTLSPQQASKANVSVVSPQMPSYPNKATPTPPTSADGDVHLSVLSNQPYLVVPLSFSHPEVPLLLLNNSCLTVSTTK